MLRGAVATCLVLAISSVVSADMNGGFTPFGPAIQTLDGVTVSWTDMPTPHDPTGTTYGVYTGVATAAGSLILLESAAAPVRDDIVNFDGIADPINDYLAVAGGVLRSVNETITPLGGNQYSIVITITGTSPTGAPGDLWPSGLASGGNPLTSGALGIGIGLPAALGGADPLSWSSAAITVNSGSLRIADGGVFGAPINIPLTLFPPNSNAWNGVLGLSLGNAATGAAVQDVLELTLNVGKVPEPTSMGLLAVGAGAVLLRRRSRVIG